MGDKVDDSVLADYEKLVGRSLLIWVNVFWEIAHELEGYNKARAEELSSAFRKIKRDLFLNQDEQPKSGNALWDEIESECMALHKQVHSLPNREPLHRRARHIEQLMRDYRALKHTT